MASLCRREIELLNLLKAARVHINYTIGVQTTTSMILAQATNLGEADLSGVNEVPTFVLIVMVRVKTFLTEVAEIISGDVGLRSIVRDPVFLQPTAATICLTYSDKR